MENSPYHDIPSIDFVVAGIAELLSELNPTKSSGPWLHSLQVTESLKLAIEVLPCLKLLSVH